MDKKIIKIIMILSIFLATNVYADEYADDIYDGDYSLQDMLENYNVITFGKKDLDSQMTQNSFSKGDLNAYHSNGNILINGSLHNMGRIDYGANIKVGSSFVTGEFFDCFYNAPAYYNPNGTMYSSTQKQCNTYCKNGFTLEGNYINFDRLYNSITNNQKKIKQGHILDTNSYTLHIPTGGEYYIDDISNIHDIIFDDFENNEDKLTIITINNSGTIRFPQLFTLDNQERYQIIPTNDYFGKEEPTSYYPYLFVRDTYYGNIIWNVPNANYIKFNTNTPFIGHLVAPNADVYGAETHYAGAFLVNSLYLEGKSETHFYPLSKKISYNNFKAKTIIQKTQGNIRFNNNLNTDELSEGMVVSFKVEAEKDYLLTDIEIKDEEGNIIEFKKVGDNEYEFTMPATDVTITPQFKEKNIKNTIEQIITNPKTGDKTILVIVIMITSLGLGTYLYKKKESSKI